jgi:hypothetical protein
MSAIGRHLEYTERLNEGEAVEIAWAQRVKNG